jgi:hypothetical protein
MMVCQQCGNAARADDAFCASCGALLEWSGQPVSGPAAPVPRQPTQEAERPQPVQLADEPVYTGPYCYSCGVRNPAGRTFCRSCGERLHGEVVRQAAHRGWWRRLMDRLRGRQPSTAGDRPRGFVRHDEVPGAVGGPAAGGAAGAGRSRASGMNQRSPRIKRPRRLVLSRFGPLLIVAGLLGVGLGPARGWVTTHLFGLETKINTHFHRHFVDIVPTGATASSAASGHGPGLAVDGVEGTYWLTSSAGGHPRLVVRFSSPQNIDYVGLLSGEPGGSYRAQARPETIKVSAPGQAAVSLSLDDTQSFQSRPVSLHGVTRISITIKNVYPGQQGQAVAIREIEFFNEV